MRFRGSDLGISWLLSAGGSAGIGKAAAHAFSHNGAVVTLIGRRLERLQAAVDSLANKAYAVTADLLVQAEIERAVKEAVRCQTYCVCPLEDQPR